MTEKETIKFDAEVEKLFKLVVHSLYENKDIFLRELISNASDACDKLRYLSITNQDLVKDGGELVIKITLDKKNKTLTVSDNGIGMTKDELVKNLGTIARSGTENFLTKLTGEKKKDVELIGQFGVGFYSSFMVADKVIVKSRAAGKKKSYIWESEGKNKFTIAELDEEIQRGTSVTLYVKDEEKDYLDKFRIRNIVETYSGHIGFKILFVDETSGEEVLNKGKAIWLKNKSEVTAEEYNEFYRSIAHMGADAPWLTLHNKAEGAIEYKSLLFIPSKKPFDIFHPDRRCHVKLYVKRVFIAEDGIDIIPPYLRFIRGVVDSEDLPLNVSRETVQNSAILQKIRRSITSKIFSELKKKAEAEPEKYLEFWNNFGAVVKEGLCDGMEPRDEIIEVCRFRTTKSGEKFISLKEYLDNMKSGQEEIYYITADSMEKAMASPQVEGFVKRGIEVILLTDSVDDFWVNVLYEYKGKALKSVTRASTEVEKTPENKEEKKDNKDGEFSALLDLFRKTLGVDIMDVRLTSRLAESPVCLTVPDGAMDIRMERFLVENKQLPSVSAKILEVNPEHAVIKKLAADLSAGGNETKITDTIHLLFAEANIIEGEPVKDIKGFISRMNALLEKSLAA